MKINEKRQDGVWIVEVSGEVDFHSSPDLREKLGKVADSQAEKVVINLKNVSYIDSSGLATFVEALQKIKRYKGKFVLAELAPAVRSVFEIAKLDTIFSLASSEQEAFQLVN